MNRRRAVPQVEDVGQRDRFVEIARAIGADEDEAAFRAKLATTARQRIGPDPKSPAEKPACKPRSSKASG